MKKLNNFNFLIKNIFNFIVIFIGLNSVALQLANAAPTAEFKNYITDNTRIAIRTGDTFNYKIVKILSAGNAVTVLEVNERKWAKVKYVNSKGRAYEGWMPSSYLQSGLTAKQLLQGEINQRKELEQKNIQLLEDLEALKSRLKTTQIELNTLSKSTFTLKRNHETLLETAKEPLLIYEQNTELKQNFQESKSKVLMLQEQVDQATDAVQRQWFLTGGGVLALGLIFGLLIGKISNKKSTWNSSF